MSLPFGLPPLVGDDDDDGGCVDYAACFGALVEAIASDDADGVRRALAGDGGVGPNDIFGPDVTAAAMGKATQRPYRGIPWTMGQAVVLAATPYIFGGGDDEDEDAGERDPDAPARDVLAPVSVPPHVQARLTRPAPMTPLGLAAAHGSIEAARALIEAGAVPWPTSEAVLNEALATMNVSAFERPDGRLHDYRPDDMVDLLLEAFERSPVLSAWDVNPLSVVLGLMSASARIAAATGGPVVGPRLSQMLLDAGYSPDERARGIALIEGFRPSPERYQEERIKATRLTSGRELLERIDGIDRRYPALTEPDLAYDQDGGQGQGGEPVPPYAPLYRDALWALAKDYSASPAGQQTARDLDEFIEQGYVPFE
ncbi:hypothetical protein pdul_cds_474 [Pandoravirus dulcis]|uniref:Uncharacterized protein n=1 Tax=Pandoravirus dulcis TaxID=1349409 RepID=S4VWW6_9VIRU|nr:hypothetical protein pdul_cds_474 [Pandoravirus dulcis]AGO82551.1 hypothetical protein pdul_cds_474 [Pandoravirus dulcis]